MEAFMVMSFFYFPPFILTVFNLLRLEEGEEELWLDDMSMRCIMLPKLSLHVISLGWLWFYVLDQLHCV